jgi:hypothetical protein
MAAMGGNGPDRRMGTMTTEPERSPAGKVMEEAIELNIEGRCPFPDRATFINAGIPDEDKWIERAFADGMAVVLVSADGSTRVLQNPDGDSADGPPPFAHRKPARS